MKENSSFCIQRSKFLSGIQRLVEVPQDIVDVFKTNAQADEIGTDPSRHLLFGGQLAVGGGSGMDSKRLRISNIGKMAEQLQTFDKLAARLGATLDSKPKIAPTPLGR